MLRDKTAARIILIFSVVNVALAAPAVIGPGHLDVAEDVTVASKKRGEDDVARDELPDPSGSSTQPGSPQTSSPPMHVRFEDGSVQPPPESDQPETLPEPVSRLDQSQSGSTSSGYGSELSWPESSTPPMRNDPEPPSGSRVQPLRTDSGSSLGSDSWHSADSNEAIRMWVHRNAVSWFAMHGHSLLPVTEINWQHDSSDPSSGLSSPSSSDMSHSESGAPAATAATPEADKFFTDELKQKMKDYAVLGTIAGISTGLINGVQKEIMGTLSPGAETIGRDLASSDVVRRGAGTPLRLRDHILPRNDPVSRGLADLRDGDLRLLSVLTRRALESLD